MTYPDLKVKEILLDHRVPSSSQSKI